MPKLPLFSVEGKSTGEIKTSDEIFGKKPNEHAVHTALTWYLAARRRGTHSAKTRAEVRGGGVKPWRQKGTGRARAGSIRSPLWRKGGVIFGPKPRDYSFNLSKKARKLALKVVLSDRARENKLKIVEELKLEKAKTKLAAKLLEDLGVSGKVLLVLGKENEIFKKASRNLAGVCPVKTGELNIFDLLMAEWVVVEKSAVPQIEEALS